LPPFECRRSLASGDVLQILRDLFALYGQPEWIQNDNGSEFIAEAAQEALDKKGIKTQFIEPGKPWQNGYNECFNGHDPYAYLKDILQRLLTQMEIAINELLPHRWVTADKMRLPGAYADG
jgi:transposase InsO family protein